MKIQRAKNPLLLLIVTGAIIISILIIQYSHVQATNIKNNETQVYSTESKPYGLTYGQWTAKWWQWAYSIPKNVNPSYDGSRRYCSEGQSGPVWFLTSSYKQVDRYCNIPAGKSILFTILNSECSFAEFPQLKTEQDLRKCAKTM